MANSGSGDENDYYFLIDDEEEQSFSVVHNTDVVYDECVKVGDKVQYFWNSKQLTGVVRFVHDDHSVCCTEADRLNKLRRKSSRNDSFDEERPRKAAQKFNNMLQSKGKKDSKPVVKSKPAQTGRRSSKPRVPKDKEKEIRKGKRDKVAARHLLSEEIADNDVVQPSVHRKSNSKPSAPKTNVKSVESESAHPAALDHCDGYFGSNDSNDSSNLGHVGKHYPEVVEKEAIDYVSSTSNSGAESVSSDSEEDDIKKNKLLSKLASKVDITILKKLFSESKKSKFSKQVSAPSEVVGTSNDSQNSKMTSLTSSSSSEKGIFKDKHLMSGIKNAALISKGNDSDPPIDDMSDDDTIKSMESEDKQEASKQKFILKRSCEAIPGTSHDDSEPAAKKREKLHSKPGSSSGKNEEKKNSASQKADHNRSPASARVNLLNNSYTGPMYRVTNGLKGGELVCAKRQIYCATTNFNYALKATTAPMAGRRLIEGVFTPEALLSCTVSGLPPRGKGKAAYSDPNSVKGFLDMDGVDAIIDLALEWQIQKHWKPRKDCSHVRSAMGVRLCELRDQAAARQSRQNPQDEGAKEK